VVSEEGEDEEEEEEMKKQRRERPKVHITDTSSYDFFAGIHWLSRSQISSPLLSHVTLVVLHTIFRILKMR
jgi:hypothetical protein